MGYAKRKKDGPLNALQVRVLKLLAEGKMHQEIADIIPCSRVNVTENARVAAVKMGAGSTAHAVAIFSRHQAYHTAAGRLLAARVRNPVDATERHVNHVLEGLAAELRATGDRLLPK